MPQHQTLDHSDLPVLCKDDVESALSSPNMNFILDFMSLENVGHYQYHGDLGVTLQNVGGRVVRCISISSREESLIILAMMEVSIRAVGGWLELAPHTVVIHPVPLNHQAEEPSEEEQPPVEVLDEGMKAV